MVRASAMMSRRRLTDLESVVGVRPVYRQNEIKHNHGRLTVFSTITPPTENYASPALP